MKQEYVLIAEPALRVARTFELLAQEAQLSSELASDGLDARTILQRRGLPALLVTNLALPKLDGFALLAELRKLAPATQVPAVAVSASMQLRTTAFGLREKLGITEIAASGMVATTLRSVFLRALATGPLRERFKGVAPVTGLRPLPDATPPPTRDPARLARMAEMQLVDDAPPEQALQQLVEETARSLGVPIALVSLVLEDRQWFKAHYGLDGDILAQRGTPLDQAFCRHVVDSDVAAPLVVPDAKEHPFFHDNVLVERGAVGSYAGAPLMTADGTVLGTLCIIDSKPLTIGAEQVSSLMARARGIAGELELRSAKKRAASLPPMALQNGETTALDAVLGRLELGVALMDETRCITFANEPFARALPGAGKPVVGLDYAAFVRRVAALSDVPEDVRRRMEIPVRGPFVIREEFAFSEPKGRVMRLVATPVPSADQAPMQLLTLTDVSAVAQLREHTDVPIFFDD